MMCRRISMKVTGNFSPAMPASCLIITKSRWMFRFSLSLEAISRSRVNMTRVRATDKAKDPSFPIFGRISEIASKSWIFSSRGTSKGFRFATGALIADPSGGTSH